MEKPDSTTQIKWPKLINITSNGTNWNPVSPDGMGDEEHSYFCDSTKNAEPWSNCEELSDKCKQKDICQKYIGKCLTTSSSERKTLKNPNCNS
jgi:hypothetical protein